MRRRLLSGACAVVMPIAALAQPATSDGSTLPLGRDSIPIYLIRGTDTLLTGHVIDDLRRITDGGGEALQRIYRSNDRVLGRRLDTLVDARISLRPIRQQSRSDRGLESVLFSERGAAGYIRTIGGDSTAVNATLAPAVINASSVDLYLRAAPLALGYTASIDAYSASLRRTVTISARVVGVDTVAREPSWRIVTDYAGMPVTFWVGRESRRLNRQLMQLRPGTAILFERGGIVTVSRAQRAS